MNSAMQARSPWPAAPGGALDNEVRAIVTTAAAATAEEPLAEFNFHNIEAYPKLAERGVEVLRFPHAVIEGLCQETTEVVADLAAHDALAREIHDSHMGFLARARAYAPHAELGFLELRQGAEG
tara:strand:- start:2959 stop:3330 length:372 start_codon:yes stop_codon:yes gene_type:complete